MSKTNLKIIHGKAKSKVEDDVDELFRLPLSEFIGARKTQQPIAKNPFRITHMTDYFLNCPFAGGIRVISELRRLRTQQRDRVIGVTCKLLDQIAVGHERDVLVVVRIVFAGLRTLQK